MKIVREIGAGVLLLEMPAFSDERGSFIKLADSRLSEIRPYEQRQLNYVVNKKKFTCRGLHYQSGEFAESKIFRVLQGSIQLVLLNVDGTSQFYTSTYSQLIDRPELAVWVPRGFATGYCTLGDSTTVLYSSDNDYRPEAEMGLRWNDPCIKKVSLPPYEALAISEKDRAWPDLIS
jgi:dTDP-4-dehydrorhamnose 3,5-epimerase